MRIINSNVVMLLAFVWGMFFLVVLADRGSQLYDQAQTHLQEYIQWKQAYDITNDISIVRYNLNDIVKKIPQYNTTKRDYDSSIKDGRVLDSRVEMEILPLLEEAAELNNVDAIMTLADFHTYGNHSVPTDYLKALNLYEKATSITPNGHAFFMLGYMYSTGMFGEIPVDQAKAQLYFQFGMETGDLASLLALGYRLSEGIGTPKNCELALIYYSRLAEYGYQYLMDHKDEIELDDVSYVIKIPDFLGGIFGREVSESPRSLVTSRRQYLDTYDQDFTLEGHDSKLLYNFFYALDEYDGYYGIPKNYSKALVYLEQCISHGEKLFNPKSALPLVGLDKIRYSQCKALLGHMYLKGQGTEKNYTKAFEILSDVTRLFNTSDALNDLGVMYENGWIGDEALPDESLAIQYYSAAIQKRSPSASKNMAKYLVNKVPFGDIKSSNVLSEIIYSMRLAATKGETEALYHYGDYIQSGFTQITDSKFTCSNTLLYYKAFIERLGTFFLPHLEYALNELGNYNYKNALLGYLMAAEQGIEKAQVSSGWLLYQSDPLSVKHQKTFDRERVTSAIKYFERASDKGDVDTSIFLGDLFFYGVDTANISVDYNKAFQLYSKAAHARSPHGCFSLAYMYENGLGVVNGSIDYFMAKRYYDLSFEYREESYSSVNQIPIYFALLRLRLKFLIWGGDTKSKYTDSEQTGWFSTFKKLGANNNNVGTNQNDREEQAQTNTARHRARVQHENEDSLFFDEEFTFSDYFVLAITVAFFAVFLFRNAVQQYRRIRNRGNPQQDNQQPQPQDQQQNGWNGNEFNFRRGNFEFHFFAI